MATLTVAIMVYSCKTETPENIDFQKVPRQVVKNMNVLRSRNGNPSMRMSAPLMEGFEYSVDDTTDCSYELYSGGFKVDAYTEDGELETTITANQAKHVTTIGQESWCAYGDVMVTNHIKGESLSTDTLYWNRQEKTIYTDCYVKLNSHSGMMQGYGMTSDERARNAVILRTFDNYFVMRDSTDVYVDSLNLLGPQPLGSK